MSSLHIEPLVIGLFSTLHCLVMCGGIVGALTVSLPVPVRQDPYRLLEYLLAYNTGRILSYAMAGFLAGLFGEAVVNLFNLDQYHARVLYAVNSLILVGVGLYVAGWLPGMVLLENLGARIWTGIEPLAQRLLPVHSRSQALVFGAVWGWFPCGLTYSVLLWAALMGGMLKGALAMAAFGVGTLPGIFMASYFSGHLSSIRRHRLIKKVLGVGIVLLALAVGFRHAPPATQPEHTHVHTEIPQ
ncbi:MAG: sulfite exporter TauE/SafE family protein [Magnetococcus sp. DMHC-8]